jgi:signal transduction histidine kinase
MVVHDDGKGADSIEMGIGLSGMKERLQATGGDLVIDTDLPGFRISAYIPTVPEGQAPAEEE